MWEEMWITDAKGRWEEAVVGADELLTENARVERLCSEDIPGMPMVKSLLPASLAAIRTARTSSTPPASGPVVKPILSRLVWRHQHEPRLKRRRLPQKTTALSVAEQVPPVPPALPVPASQATGAPSAFVKGPVAVKRKPQPPPPKARTPPPAGQLYEASGQAFNEAARERWRRPGQSGKAEPPTLVFLGANRHGSL